MSTIKTTQPKRKLNLSPVTVRVLSSTDQDSLWGAENSHGSPQTSNPSSGGGGSHTTVPRDGSHTNHNHSVDQPAPPPPPQNPPNPQRGDGAA